MGRLARLFSFTGRTTRIGFWRTWLLLNLLAVVAWAIAITAVMNSGPAGGWFMLLFAPFVVAIVAVVVRRLHDRGKSGWWAVPLQIGPFTLMLLANYLIGLTGAPGWAGTVALVLILAGLVLAVWAWIELGFLPSKPGPNRYAA